MCLCQLKKARLTFRAFPELVAIGTMRNALAKAMRALRGKRQSKRFPWGRERMLYFLESEPCGGPDRARGSALVVH